MNYYNVILETLCLIYQQHKDSFPSKKKVVEGEIYVEELKEHLNKWNSPLFINIHIDDTRILNKVEYDPATNRFVGFCLPLKDGLPIVDTFVLESFEDIKAAYESKTIGKYAHCLVAKSIDTSVPSFVLFVLCTDSRYDHQIVLDRLSYIEAQLKRYGVTVISIGADGAGPFLKAMTTRSNLFKRCYEDNVPRYWTFYWMPRLLDTGLCCQDLIHLLAKLRTRLLTPSNLLVLGDETACPGHLQQLLKSFSKAEHGLTQQALQNKDKQNYSSIENLLDEGVINCLKQMKDQRTNGTIIYLWIMRNIRNSFFDKSLSPLERINLIWKSTFFLRIWRLWLYNNIDYNEADHFITINAYVCTEINAHLVTNVVINIINGNYPKEAMRLWTYGSQACEQTSRMLRSMTSVFSTIVNFSMKGMLLFQILKIIIYFEA